jgi:hypothetical protein
VEAPSEPRYITTDQTVQGLGLNILGGNATGIFVCDVKSPGYDLGIRVGDQILEVSFESVGSGFSLQIHVKRVSQRSAESRGFSPGAPVSSHRESWQGGLG